jgi:fumarate reductase flavoprotein subunit
LGEREFDVIVVGAGTAGLPAAICAAERGLKVGLVEAAAEIGGTLHLSSASISAAGTSIQAKAGVEDSPERHFKNCLQLNHGTGDLRLLERWTQEAPAMVEWLLSLGWTCDPDAPTLAYEHNLYDTPRTYRSAKQGFSLIEAFTPAIERLRASGAVALMLNTRFTDLVMDGDAVVGIKASQDGRTISLKSRAVVLTTGGYTASERHWQDLHNAMPLRYYRDASMGDGLDAVAKIGGYTRFAHYGLPAFGATRNLDSPASAWIHTVILPHFRPPWEIYVNTLGQRFMPEDEPSIDRRERYVAAQPGWAFWVIYDQAIRETSPQLFRWTEAELDELFAHSEDYVIADTLEDLEIRCGLPGRSLVNTVDDYNRGQAVGSDWLGRRHLPLPLGAGPFYAVKHYGVSITSAAGVAVDTDLAVIRQDGAPIEGLYAAGEAIGYGVLGHSFLSGSIVSAAVTFGRLLGQKVLA